MAAKRSRGFCAVIDVVYINLVNLTRIDCWLHDSGFAPDMVPGYCLFLRIIRAKYLNHVRHFLQPEL
jgi:hypothetical protein